MQYRTREQKYPDTEYFKYFNANNHNRKSGDCAVRAICTALDESWEDTLTGLFEIGVKWGYTPTDYHTIERYLASKGWIKMSEPRNADNTRMSVMDFIRRRGPQTRIVANVGSHHMAAIVNKQVHDIWNSSYETMHSYWVKGVENV